MLKYVSKFALDILPSVTATIIGAYVVNHYIVTRPGAYAPFATAVAPSEPKAASGPAKTDAKAFETSSDVANIPAPGVRAKGISEKAIFDRSAGEKSVERSPAVEKSEKPAEKPIANKPAETASIPADTRRHQLAPREKTAAKAVPASPQPSAPAVAPNPAPPVEAAVAPEERRDANDLARAAIERLRGANEGSPRADGSPRAQEVVRIPDPPRSPDTARAVSAPPVRPLPPPIMVSTPSGEASDSSAGSAQTKQPYAARTDDPLRPTPPADIPSPPLDLRAEVAAPSAREHTTVAEDVLSAAKSVFHSVLPK